MVKRKITSIACNVHKNTLSQALMSFVRAALKLYARVGHSYDPVEWPNYCLGSIVTVNHSLHCTK